MNKLTIVLAGVAALGLSSAAFAEDGSTGPAPMTDSEMDGVTAGGAAVVTPGPGVDVTLPAQGANDNSTEPRGALQAGDNPATRHGPPL